jgi:hypothetical protein
LVYSSTLKMEAICSSETSVDFQFTTQPCIPDDNTFHKNGCENLKSYKNRFLDCRLSVCLYVCMYVYVCVCVREDGWVDVTIADIISIFSKTAPII